ncbi:N-acetylmuramoyl-L-alanine amidase [Bacillus sp. G1(2015b)]|uniref:N-acetylmuramoyl-L-alanine amidase n=1 Tax=Bacillus sp. G1(2015b) TaxID=1706732 RepID=UPI00073869FF|nr:N-acetylmuramoyl-L-alanine amidase [Bacillus sp. G1(2015b)]KUF25510.1 N-acetylmuramoyl-L-alanine amidase [Bacillus sp. G1(2015b)]
MVKIFIDPGHGGTDSGASANGLLEKNITLQIALLLRDILISEYDGVSVRLSRSTDQSVTLSQRTNAANSWGANYFVSIHINAGGGTGFESYVYPGVSAPTTTYRNALHDEIVRSVDFANRGKKTANFHVLRETSMPAILTENGFIDTTADANKLRNATFLQGIAHAHATGLEEAFQLKKKASNLYKVQAGAFKVKANADELAATLKSKGFDAFVVLVGGMFRVQAGAFRTKQNADDLVARLKQAGHDAFVFQ